MCQSSAGRFRMPLSCATCKEEVNQSPIPAPISPRSGQFESSPRPAGVRSLCTNCLFGRPSMPSIVLVLVSTAGTETHDCGPELRFRRATTEPPTAASAHTRAPSAGSRTRPQVPAPVRTRSSLAPPLRAAAHVRAPPQPAIPRARDPTRPDPHHRRTRTTAGPPPDPHPRPDPHHRRTRTRGRRTQRGEPAGRLAGRRDPRRAR